MSCAMTGSACSKCAECCPRRPADPKGDVDAAQVGPGHRHSVLHYFFAPYAVGAPQECGGGAAVAPAASGIRSADAQHFPREGLGTLHGMVPRPCSPPLDMAWCMGGTDVLMRIHGRKPDCAASGMSVDRHRNSVSMFWSPMY